MVTALPSPFLQLERMSSFTHKSQVPTTWVIPSSTPFLADLLPLATILSESHHCAQKGPPNHLLEEEDCYSLDALTQSFTHTFMHFFFHLHRSFKGPSLFFEVIAYPKDLV